MTEGKFCIEGGRGCPQNQGVVLHMYEFHKAKSKAFHKTKGGGVGAGVLSMDLNEVSWHQVGSALNKYHSWMLMLRCQGLSSHLY